MRHPAILLAATAMLPTIAFSAPDFSNGGSFQIGGSFTPNDGNNVQGSNQGNSQGSGQGSVVSSVISSVAGDIASVTRSFNMPDMTPGSDNSLPSNSVIGNQIQGMTLGGDSNSPPNPMMTGNSMQDMTLAGVAQPTMGMNMMQNNTTAPINGATAVRVPQVFILIAHLAGILGF